jgi:hypothetical protein
MTNQLYHIWNILLFTAVLTESSRAIIVVTASVEENERVGKGHIFASLLHQFAMRDRTVNTHYFYTSAFLTLHIVFNAIDGKIEEFICIKFWAKPLKSATKTIEMLREALDEIP